MERTDLAQIEDSLDYISSQLYGIRKALETLVSIAGAPEEPAKPLLKPALIDTEKVAPRVKPAMIENGDGKPLLMGMGLHALHVSRRAQNCLWKAGCRNVGDVTRKSASSLYCTRGVGMGVLQEIRAAMRRLGLKLAGD